MLLQGKYNVQRKRNQRSTLQTSLMAIQVNNGVARLDYHLQTTAWNQEEKTTVERKTIVSTTNVVKIL